MKQFIIAMQFLTIMRLSKNLEVTPEELATSMGYFPMVGLLLGFILIFFNVLLSPILPGSVVDGILILTLIICTGALHLDGLADTIDGFAGGNSKEEILQIMRDSRIGAIGAAGLTMILLLKYACLLSIPDEFKNQVLIVMPVISRCSIVQISFFSDYARSGSGIGQPFAHYVGKRELLLAAITALLLSLILLGAQGLALTAIIGLTTWGLSALYRSKIGGATGDTVGATNEISEVLVLILALALLRSVS